MRKSAGPKVLPTAQSTGRPIGRWSAFPPPPKVHQWGRSGAKCGASHPQLKVSLIAELLTKFVFTVKRRVFTGQTSSSIGSNTGHVIWDFLRNFFKGLEDRTTLIGRIASRDPVSSFLIGWLTETRPTFRFFG
jgi:hypothetical protein